jgi:hypothetical protein
MPLCPICQTEFRPRQDGQLCPSCRASVLASDTYSVSDLRFVGVLAGILTAAIASMPGAMVGYFIGRSLENASRGCLIGVITFALAGFVAGLFIGPLAVRKMEAAKHAP